MILANIISHPHKLQNAHTNIYTLKTATFMREDGSITGSENLKYKLRGYRNQYCIRTSTFTLYSSEIHIHIGLYKRCNGRFMTQLTKFIQIYDLIWKSSLV